MKTTFKKINTSMLKQKKLNVITIIGQITKDSQNEYACNVKKMFDNVNTTKIIEQC